VIAPYFAVNVIDWEQLLTSLGIMLEISGVRDTGINLRKKAVLYLILTGSNACTTSISGDFCLLYELVYADYKKDTPETIKQIDKITSFMMNYVCLSPLLSSRGLFFIVLFIRSSKLNFNSYIAC
jgi:hypothetical protein